MQRKRVRFGWRLAPVLLAAGLDNHFSGFASGEHPLQGIRFPPIDHESVLAADLDNAGGEPALI